MENLDNNKQQVENNTSPDINNNLSEPKKKGRRKQAPEEFKPYKLTSLDIDISVNNIENNTVITISYSNSFGFEEKKKKILTRNKQDIFQELIAILYNLRQTMCTREDVASVLGFGTQQIQNYEGYVTEFKIGTFFKYLEILCQNYSFSWNCINTRN